MLYIHTEEGLVIRLTWKERFIYFLTGNIKFNRKGSYQYYNHFLHVISKGLQQYGDVKEHGESKEIEESV